MYCIACEEDVDLISDFHIHYIGYYEADFDYCDGPFTSSPPPVITEEMWEATFASELSDEELAQMDENTETLMLD